MKKSAFAPLLLALSITLNMPLVSWATIASKSRPAGTLLIPMEPKIDTGVPTDLGTALPSGQSNHAAGSTHAALPPTSGPDASRTHNGQTESSKPIHSQTTKANAAKAKSEIETISCESGSESTTPTTPEDSDLLLKASIELVADDTEYDQNKNTFLGTGNAVAIIAGQNSKLEADTILYDQNNQTIDARGNVRILRDGQLTTGSAFKFNVTSDEYLITNPDTEIQSTTVIARKAVGSKTGLAFRDGTMELPKPFHFMSNPGYGPLSASEIVGDKTAHPDAYLPSKPNFVFKARQMTLERYKDQGNLTVVGGRLKFGDFSLPMGKFVATVGQENNRVFFPVTPMMTNNLQMGGLSFGPSFNYAVGKTGAFQVAPMIQMGGRQPGNTSGSNWGAGGRITYTNARIISHLAYGSVSNLLVADFKAKIRKGLQFQSGINRYLQDGLFGYRRARFLAEAVDNHGISGVPFLSSLSFRTAAGFAQDNPALLQQTPSSYQSLFHIPQSTAKVAAFRVSEQIMAMTKPLFAVGDNVMGAKMLMSAGAGWKGYSTGDSMTMGQVGPIIDFHLKRVRLRTGYNQAVIRGQSPFVFDQFIQGSKSVNLSGDVKINKYLTLGYMTGYNLDAKAAYQKTLTAAVGPEDFKVMLSHDSISGMNRFGVDLLFGQPIPFQRLLFKGNPDQGQLGGI